LNFFKKIIDNNVGLWKITTYLVVIKMNDTNRELVIGREPKLLWLDIVQRQVNSLRYGVVQIVVHDSQVTQIDKTERVRLERTRGETA
jgi:hypothetical protein